MRVNKEFASPPKCQRCQSIVLKDQQVPADHHVHPDSLNFSVLQKRYGTIAILVGKVQQKKNKIMTTIQTGR